LWPFLRESLRNPWQRQLERARYEAQRAERPYGVVDPLCSAQCYVVS